MSYDSSSTEAPQMNDPWSKAGRFIGNICVVIIMAWMLFPIVYSFYR